MRAREFIINVPINIKINGDGDPEINMPGQENDQDQAEYAFIPPLQQKIEMMKANAGNESDAFDQIISDDDDTEAD